MVALLLVPGAFVVFLGFQSGGFDPGPTAVAGVGAALLLVLRLAFSRRPLTALGRAHALAGGALAALAAWTLLSGTWSKGPARALLEFDRTLVYLFVFLLFATVPQSPERLRWLLRGLFAGVLVVCLAGLLSRLMPDSVSVAAIFDNRRLRYPLESWNGLGFMAGLGIVLALHLTTSDREWRVLRVVGAAAIPPLAATLLLTFSRGGTAAAALGVGVYVLLAWQRGLLPGLIATVPTAAIALIATDAANLTSQDPLSAAAINDGSDLAPILLGATLGAAGLRALLLPLDRLAERIQVSAPRRRLVMATAAGVAAVIALTAAIGFDVPSRLTAEVSPQEGARLNEDVEGRLGQVRLDRVGHYRLALVEWRAEPMHGQGAGMFELLWNRDPQTDGDAAAIDGHSLYIETLAELGVVGLVLIVILLATLAFGLARRIRGAERATYAAAFALVAIWIVHAGIDWDWEVPALSIWVFAIAGLALARPPTAETRSMRPRIEVAVRVGLAVVCTALAVIPVLVAMSENRLTDATRALVRGDCRTAVAEARDARALLGRRPEAYAILGYCELWSGRPDRAARTFRAAAERDPWNWRYHYALAVSAGAAGRDPQTEARSALRLNSTDVVVRAMTRRLERAGNASARRTIASRVPLPLDDRVLGHGQRFTAWRCGTAPFNGREEEPPRPVLDSDLGPLGDPSALCPVR